MRREARMSAALYQSRLSGFGLHGSVSSLAAVSDGWGGSTTLDFPNCLRIDFGSSKLEVSASAQDCDCFDWVDSLID